MSRNDLIVKVGRLIQGFYNYFSFLDMPFELKKKKSDKLIICLLAAPRSGSTLTYQLLSTGIQSSSLRNLSNLLYSTPLLGNKLCNLLCKNYISSFKSSRGFVNGICGEAEGLKFWTYWMGQGLVEDKDSLNISNLKKLKKKIEKFDDDVIITGYLGHVFSVKELEDTFENIIFVHLKRDLLSNATSLLNLGSTSSCPKELIHSKKNKYEFVLRQIELIHKSISKESNKNVIILNYEDICDDPKAQLEKIRIKALEKGFKIKLKKENIPDNFVKSITKSEKNKDTKKIQNYIDNMDVVV